MGWRSKYIILTLIFGGLAVILQLISFCSPGWLILEISGTSVNFAVWYVITCVAPSSTLYGRSDRKCFTLSYYDLKKNSMDSTTKELQNFHYMMWVEWEIEVTLALVFCSVGLCLSVKALSEVKRDRTFQEFNRTKKQIFGGFILMLLSGILILVPVGKLGQFITGLRQMKSFYQDMDDDGSYSRSTLDVGVPYGLVIAGFGGSFSSICAILLVIAYAKYTPPPEVIDEIATSSADTSRFISLGYKPCSSPIAEPPPEYTSKHNTGEVTRSQGTYLHPAAVRYTPAGVHYIPGQPFYHGPQGYALPQRGHGPGMEGYNTQSKTKKEDLKHDQGQPITQKGKPE